MKKVALLTLTVSTGLFLASCSAPFNRFSYQHDCLQNVGKSKEEILKMYGEPKGVELGADGTEELVYVRSAPPVPFTVPGVSVLTFTLKDNKVVSCKVSGQR